MMVYDPGSVEDGIEETGLAPASPRLVRVAEPSTNARHFLLTM
jgi:hypothetical protein